MGSESSLDALAWSPFEPAWLLSGASKPEDGIKLWDLREAVKPVYSISPKIPVQEKLVRFHLCHF
jgi:hypothetical protein